MHFCKMAEYFFYLEEVTLKRALSVNIDHIATLRQVRKGTYPFPVHACSYLEMAGCEGITVHLRTDRRHIQDDDVVTLLKSSNLPVCLEMAAEPEMISFATKYKPHKVTLVPERAEELTTEGGLDAVKWFDNLKININLLNKAGMVVTLFLEPDMEQIEAAFKLGVSAVEIHTGNYADAYQKYNEKEELEKIKKAAEFGTKKGLIMNVGHGLHYQNTGALAEIDTISEFSIGHAIISRAVFCGLEEAVREMHRIVHRR